MIRTLRICSLGLLVVCLPVLVGCGNSNPSTEPKLQGPANPNVKRLEMKASGQPGQPAAQKAAPGKAAPTSSAN